MSPEVSEQQGAVSGHAETRCMSHPHLTARGRWGDHLAGSVTGQQAKPDLHDRPDGGEQRLAQRRHSDSSVGGAVGMTLRPRAPRSSNSPATCWSVPSPEQLGYHDGVPKTGAEDRSVTIASQPSQGVTFVNALEQSIQERYLGPRLLGISKDPIFDRRSRRRSSNSDCPSDIVCQRSRIAAVRFSA